MGKKKEDDGPTEPKERGDIGSIINNIKKRYGEHSIARASESPAVRIERIPSGIYGIDKLLEGGWPLGRIVQIYGKEQGGKTTTLLKTVANAQRYCRDCLKVRPERKFYDNEPTCKCKKPKDFETIWLDVEGVYDEEWAAAVGVDNSLVWVTRPSYAEEGLDIMDGVVREADASLVIVDTITMLTPKEEVEKSAEEQTMALRARMINRAVRKLVMSQNALGMLSQRRLIVFLVCHINVGIGGWMPTEEKAGGKTKEYANSFELRFKKAKVEKVDIGKMSAIECEVKKSKITSTMGDLSTYHLVTKPTSFFPKGIIDETPMLFKDAAALGTIYKEGKYYRIHP